MRAWIASSRREAGIPVLPPQSGSASSASPTAPCNQAPRPGEAGPDGLGSRFAVIRQLLSYRVP